MSNRPAHPQGHFYSPIVDTDEAARDASRIWPVTPEVLGIDFNDTAHERILKTDFPKYISDYDYPESGPADRDLDHFYTANSQFSWLDSRLLFVLLRSWRPARMIEVGSGYSTLLMTDINRRFLDSSMQITCVEPYPREFLHNQARFAIRLIESRVQDVDLSQFASLTAGDVLFIDSSHVAKTGSDVNFIYFEILPRLASGVRVHIHDIFLPHDYPRDWVIDENRSWNEQYLLRAVLMDSSRYRVEFGCSYAFWRFPELVRSALAHPAGHAFAGGSFWLSIR